MKHQMVKLPILSLEVCDRTRVRHQKPKDGSDIVLEYAEAYQCGLIIEPLDVFREKGTERYIVADGEHRLLALRRANIKEVECRLYEGDEIDALRFASRCNQKHGLRRTKADVYHTFCRIMETRLRDEFRTDSELSEQLGISVRTVKAYRAEWRDSEGGNSRVKARKEAAKERAASHSSKGDDARSSVRAKAPSRAPRESPNVQIARSESRENQEVTRAHARTDAPKEVAPRSSSSRTNDGGRDWSKEDEATYKALCEAWDQATRSAQIRFAMDHR